MYAPCLMSLDFLKCLYVLHISLTLFWRMLSISAEMEPVSSWRPFTELSSKGRYLATRDMQHMLGGLPATAVTDEIVQVAPGECARVCLCVAAACALLWHMFSYCILKGCWNGKLGCEEGKTL